METSGHKAVLKAIEERLGEVDQDMLSSILALRESENLESLLDDLKIVKNADELGRTVSFLSGKEYGYIEGLRAAIDVVLGIDDDESAEQISDQAFDCYDPETLERLLILAASPLRHTAPSSN